MRTVAQIPHRAMRIVVQEWNEKYHVQFVWGPLEQTYRLPVEGSRRASGCAGICAALDPRGRTGFPFNENSAEFCVDNGTFRPRQAMTTAEEKRDQHIVEYILYLWQMEDLVRAVNLDLTALRSHLSAAYQGDRLESELMWFAELIQSLKREKKTSKGHVGALDEVMIELTYLHRTLLDVLKDEEYKSAVRWRPNRTWMKWPSAEKPTGTEVEAMLVALYGWLVLRMGGKSVFRRHPGKFGGHSRLGQHFGKPVCPHAGRRALIQLAFFLRLGKAALMDLVLFFSRYSLHCLAFVHSDTRSVSMNRAKLSTQSP